MSCWSKTAELLWIIIQVTGALLDGVSHPLSWWVNPNAPKILGVLKTNSNMNIVWSDLFWTFTDSLYNTTFKILFIGSSAYIIYLMLNDYKPTHDPNLDTFKVQYLLGFSALFALVFSHDYRISEVSVVWTRVIVICIDTSQVLWTFSIWLESVAILPQLFMLQRTGEADTITTHYIFALGTYRALYIPNWLYRYFAESRFEPNSVVAGIIQTLLYSDFFYIYYTK